MTTTTNQCSKRVSHRISSNWSESAPCARKATVTREGKPYCTTHDPERRLARALAKCSYRGDNLGRQCGRPAVAERYGSGRCERHTPEALDTRRHLLAAAPVLLEALRAFMFLGGGIPQPEHWVEWDNKFRAACRLGAAAIAQATGKE